MFLIYKITIVVLALFMMLSAIRILKEYERGVIFRLGRVFGIKGPGLILLIPFVDKMVRVSLRTVTMDIPPQDVLTKDNVTVKVSAVIHFAVVDANKAVVAVEDYLYATSQIAQKTLRSMISGVKLDNLLSNSEQINQKLRHIIDDQTEPFGIEVSVVEVKNVVRVEEVAQTRRDQ